jgi:hypothetical protein
MANRGNQFAAVVHSDFVVLEYRISMIGLKNRQRWELNEANET